MAPKANVDPRLGIPALAAYRLAREKRLQEAEAGIAHDRLLEVLATIDSIESHALAVEVNAIADVRDAPRRWEAHIGPALDRLDVAVASEDAKAATAAVKQIASALRIRLQFEAN